MRRKKNTEDNDDVSLHTLNDKLDQILEEVRGKESRRVAQVEIVKDKNPQAENPTALTGLKHCRSMQEVLEGGFKYDRYSGIVTFTKMGLESGTSTKHQ